MKFHYAAALSLTALLSASCGDCCTGGEGLPTSSSLTVDGAGSSVDVLPSAAVKGPEAVLNSAVQSLKAHKVSQFVSLVFAAEAVDDMKAEWSQKRKEEVSEEDNQEFREFMAMLTADGAEEALFMMAKPHLAEAQEQLEMMASMAPMMAAGAVEESGAPALAMVYIQALAPRLAKMNVADEDKCKEAIGILCKAARSLELESISDMQKLEFDAVMKKADIAFGMVMDVVAVYGLSFDEALASIEIKTISQDSDLAEMEITMNMFGPRTSPYLFPMVKGDDGRWTLPNEDPSAATETQPGLAR